MINKECPCEYESTDQCAICRDRNTTVKMYSIEEIIKAIKNEHPIVKSRILDALLND